MDITSFVTGSRDRAFLVGDYNSYRSQLTRQLLSLRKKLGRTTGKNAKFVKKAPVTVEDIGGNHAFVQLLLIQAERAWAQAMHMKSTHAEDNTSTGLVGSTRRHIISRLHKAHSYAQTLATLLQDRTTTGATDTDYLEAQAYAQCLAGAEEFEKQSGQRKEDPRAAWKECLVAFSNAHIIYSALLFSTQKDIYKEVLAGTVDPSIRYAAYQSRLPRSSAISTVAKQHFQRDQADLQSLVQKLNPTALEDEKAATTTGKDGANSAAVSVPTTITWRGRVAPISDAGVGQALGATYTAAAQLSSILSSHSSSTTSTFQAIKAAAAAYDPVLTAAQDTIDAVRRALSDAAKEGTPESDPRVQDLRVSDLAANYALVSWRIGRNRILISTPGTLDDGATFTPEAPPHRHYRKKRRGKAVRGDDFFDAAETTDNTKPKFVHAPITKIESKPRQIAHLTDRVVLYDATLQSIDSIKELRGASRDSTFIAELDGQRAYFQALRCLNIAFAHKVLGNHKEALALFARATEHASSASASATSPTSAANPETPAGTTLPPTLTITSEQLANLRAAVDLQLTRQHGLVALHQLTAAESAAAEAASPYLLPLAERLHEYPAYVDLTRFVEWPPKLRPVPVKPIFLDLAWNYIKYPGDVAGDGDAAATVAGVVEKGVQAVSETVGSAAKVAAGVIGGEREQARRREEDEQGGQQGQKKKGWGGWFGRG